ncbi:MAG: DNA alkylation repair protein [Sphingobacteriales bacterium]|nr:MAG: DNA alkylation repair protein [Sphingobacteriales bacterium]
MSRSTQAKNIYIQISAAGTQLGDLRKIAKTIKKDHALAMELWHTGEYMPRQLALLIMDPKMLSQAAIEVLDKDMQQHVAAEQLQLADWLMANQLAKNKQTIALMQSWRDSPSVLQRRLFWYYQGRLRWTGQVPPNDTEELLTLIEARIETEQPAVQWAMNFTAAQIGIFRQEYRQRCIELGERTGLYKDVKVAKNCTPDYLPEWIAMQVAKLKT